MSSQNVPPPQSGVDCLKILKADGTTLVKNTCGGVATLQEGAGIGFTLSGTKVTLSYGPTILGGLLGSYVNTASSASVTWAPFASASTVTTFAMPFSAWATNLTGYIDVASVNGALWTGSFPGNNGFPPSPFSIPPSSAAGAYQSAASFQVMQSVTHNFSESGIASSPTNSTLRSVSWEVVGANAQPLGAVLQNNVVAGSSTVYTGPSQGATANATEALMGVIIPYASTAKNLCIKTANSQPAGSTGLTLTLRKNGTTSTAVTVNIPASNVLGLYCDLFAATGDSATFAAGDWMTWQLANASGSNSAQISTISMELDPTGVGPTGMVVFGMGGETLASGAAGFFPGFVNVAANTTESQVRAAMPRAVTMKNLYCIYTTPPGTNPVVVTVMKNGAAPASGLTVSIPTTGAGTQTISDTTDTISYANLDNFDIQFNQTAGANPAISSCSVEVD